MSKKTPAVPKHVAIIPDGNRRWAKKRGLKPWEGHREGIGKNSQDVANVAFESGVEYLTIWGGSYDNFAGRPAEEVKNMNIVYKSFIKNLRDDGDIYEKKIRVAFVGEWRDVLEKPTIEAINEIESETKDFEGHYFTILSAYNGDRELIDAVNRLIEDSKENPDQDTIKSYLWTHDLPPVDLLIRTGVEDDPHNSTGFMMWHTRDSQLLFSEILLPEFGKEDFLAAIESYQSRERRFGK